MSGDAFTFEGALQEVYTERLAVMIDRQRKYGPDNILATGLLGVAVRMRDKWERIWRSVGGGREDFDDESLRDALIDLGNYADIALMLLDETWGAPLQEECPPAWSRDWPEWSPAPVCRETK